MGVDKIDFEKFDVENWEQVFVKGFQWVRECNKGYLPLQAYLGKVITFPTVYVDVAPVFTGGDVPEVLLVKRGDTEAIFPGYWHIAGGATLGRQTVDDKRRSLVQECGAAGIAVRFQFAGAVYMPKTKLEIADVKLFVALTRIKWTPPSNAEWFSLVGDMPDPMVPAQYAVYITLIQQALMGQPPKFVEYLREQ